MIRTLIDRVARPVGFGIISGILALPPVAHAGDAGPRAPRPKGLARDAIVRHLPDDGCLPLPPPRSRIPWEPGERLSYDIDVVGAQAGKLALVALPTVGSGRSAEHPFRALAASNSFFSKIRRVRGRSTSYVRARDWQPRRYEEASTEGAIRKAATVIFKRPDEGRRVEVDYQRNQARRKYRYGFLHQAFDPVSAVYYLRNLEFEKGMPICFDAYAIRKLWRVRGEVKGLETVKVPAGVFQAWHLQGEAVRTDDPDARREVHIWISADERRLPLAALGVIDLGGVRAQLTHVDRGSATDSENDLVVEEPAAAAVEAKTPAVD